MSNKIDKHIIISLFFFFLITIIIYFPIPIDNIERYLPYLIRGSHADWTFIIDAIKCNSIGYNVYINNPCGADAINRPLTYGEIFLYIPYFDKLDLLYYNILPNFINYFFILILFKIFNPTKIKGYILLFFLLILQPFILVLERTNSDLIIFICIFFMAKYNNLVTYYIFLLIITLSKFYPITLVSIFLFLKKTRSVLTNISFFLFLLSILLFFQLENIKHIIEHKSQLTAGLSSFNFSFYLMPKIFFFIFDNYNLGIKLDKIYFYFFYFFIFFSIFLLYFIFLKKKGIFNQFNFSSFNERLFFMGLVVSVTCYFILDNWLYREIFLILLIPFLIYFPYKENLFYIHNLKNLIYLKFITPSLMSLLAVFFYPENTILIGINYIIKSSIDNLLLILLFSNLVYIMFLTLKKIR